MKKVVKEIFDQERYVRALQDEANSLLAERSKYSPFWDTRTLTEEELKEITEKVKKQDFLITKKEYLLHKITLDSSNDVVFIVSDLDGRNFQHIEAKDCTIIEVDEKEANTNSQQHGKENIMSKD